MKYLQKIVGIMSVGALMLPLFAGALTPPLPTLPPSTSSEVLGYYQYVSKVPNVQISVPTMVEVAFYDSSVGHTQSPIVYEKNADRFVQTTVKIPQNIDLKPSISVSRNSGTRTTSLLDGDKNTFYTVEAYPDGVQRGDKWISTISLVWNQPITASEAIFAVDAAGALPTRVMITGDGDTVVPWQVYAGEQIPFGSNVTANRFQIQFEHIQDVHITDVSVPYTVDSSTRMSFLMQPNEIYEIYTDPISDVPYNSYTKTSRYGEVNAQYVGHVSPSKNSLYWEGDLDGDSIPASQDNCLDFSNPDQVDENKNNIGDACEDFDQDGVAGAVDNCPDRPNSHQRDTDDDGIGDECDPEESRLTEQYSWVPFIGILVAGIVLVALFISVVLAARKIKEDEEVDSSEEDSLQDV